MKQRTVVVAWLALLSGCEFFGGESRDVPAHLTGHYSGTYQATDASRGGSTLEFSVEEDGQVSGYISTAASEGEQVVKEVHGTAERQGAGVRVRFIYDKPPAGRETFTGLLYEADGWAQGKGAWVLEPCFYNLCLLPAVSGTWAAVEVSR